MVPAARSLISAAITERELVAACQETLAQWPQARAAVLFGSRARGTQRPDSDWDVAFVLEGGELRHPSPARLVFPHSGMPADLDRVDVEYSNNCPYGATFVMYREADGPDVAQTSESKLSPIPVIKPPYAYLVAIDFNADEIVWKVPFGERSREIREHPLLRGVRPPARLGTRSNAGAIVTRGGLMYLGSGTPYLYAFDKATGVEL